MAAKMDLIVCMFDGIEKADEARQAIQQLDAELDTVKLGNIAVLKRDEAGKFSFTETEDVQAGRGGLMGLVVGGLLGIVGGPLGMAAGAAAGTLAGGIAADRIDMGFPDSALEALKEHMQHGSSMLVTLLLPEEAEVITVELVGMGGNLLEHYIPEDLSERLLAAAKQQDAADQQAEE